jgi:hypothetical protein
MGAMISLAMTQPSWSFEGFLQLALHAERQADYLPDAMNLSFAPVNPEIVDDVHDYQVEITPSLDGSETNDGKPAPDFPTATAQPTSLISGSETPPSLPTNPSLPTLPLPTDPLPTLALPTAPNPILPLPTVDILPTIPIVSGVVNTLVPTAIPCLLLLGCP